MLQKKPFISRSMEEDVYKKIKGLHGVYLQAVWITLWHDP